MTLGALHRLILGKLLAQGPQRGGEHTVESEAADFEALRSEATKFMHRDEVKYDDDAL